MVSDGQDNRHGEHDDRFKHFWSKKRGQAEAGSWKNFEVNSGSNDEDNKDSRSMNSPKFVSGEKNMRRNHKFIVEVATPLMRCCVKVFKRIQNSGSIRIKQTGEKLFSSVNFFRKLFQERPLVNEEQPR